MESSERLGELLTARGDTISVAETTAGGLISSLIVSVPGSSAYFERGIVAYSQAAKVESLGISADDLAEHGAVSVETASLLAQAVRSLSGTTYGLAETGIAGPIRGRSQKPLGTVHIAVAGPEETGTRSLVLEGGRQDIRDGIAREAVAFLVTTVEARRNG